MIESDMRKSEYGENLRYYSEIFKTLGHFEIEVVKSTFNMDKDYSKIVEDSWNDAKKNNPDIFDAGKWRFEGLEHGIKDDKPIITIYVSGDISNSQHNVLRHVKDKPIEFYPNPLTVNVIQETKDGYLLLRKSGKESNQKNIAFVGAEFVERYMGETTPEGLGYTIQKECLEKTKYNMNKNFNMNNANVLGIALGSNHDTSVISHLPIFGRKEDVDINGDESDEIIYLPNNKKDIMKVLESGKLDGIKLADHTLGGLELYLKHKKTGQI